MYDRKTAESGTYCTVHGLYKQLQWRAWDNKEQNIRWRQVGRHLQEQ